MAFFALKPCNFGGFAFRIGEKIPAGLVAPSRVQWFIMNGYLAESPEMSKIDNLEIPIAKTPEPAVDSPETLSPDTVEPKMTQKTIIEKPCKNGKK